MPVECESADAHPEAYNSTKVVVHCVISLPSCSKVDCATCMCISGLCEHETVACCLKSLPYKKQKELPISCVLGNNSSCFQKFVKEELVLSANVCQTHATAIAKNNGTHRTYFDSNEHYDVFYDFVCSIMQCSFPDAGVLLQELLMLWLRSVKKTLPRIGSNDIDAARSRDAGYWLTAASPSLSTIKAWNQHAVAIAWPTAKDTRCVGKEWGGLGKEWGGLGKSKTDF